MLCDSHAHSNHIPHDCTSNTGKLCHRGKCHSGNAIAIVGRGRWAGLFFLPQWQFKFQAHFDKWFGLPQCLKTYHLSLYNINKDMLLTGPFAMLSMPSLDFHLLPCTEGFLIPLSPLWQLPLWQLPLFPSVAQFPCDIPCTASYSIMFRKFSVYSMIVPCVLSNIHSN